MMGSKERAFGSLCNLSLETLVPADNVDRHAQTKLQPERAIVDARYRTIDNIRQLEDMGIRAYLSLAMGPPRRTSTARRSSGTTPSGTNTAVGRATP